MATMLEKPFLLMGARAVITTLPNMHRRRTWNGRSMAMTFSGDAPLRIDILRDQSGEYFDIQRLSGVRLDVADVRPEDRHLVLSARDVRGDQAMSTFLCGHDERAWFVAAIPEEAKARTVQEAKDALKPQEVWTAIEEFQVPMEERDERHTEAFVRQGERF